MTLLDTLLATANRVSIRLSFAQANINIVKQRAIPPVINNCALGNVDISTSSLDLRGDFCVASADDLDDHCSISVVVNIKDTSRVVPAPTWGCEGHV